MVLNLQVNTYAPEISMSGLTYHRNQDGVNIYKFDNFRRETLDLWLEISQHNDQVTLNSGGTTLLMLLDVRNAGAPTPYALAQGLQAANEIPNTIYRINAIVTVDGLANQVIKFILHKIPKKIAALKIVSSEEDAVTWLIKTREDYLKGEPA